MHTLFFTEDDQQTSFPSETHQPGYLRWGEGERAEAKGSQAQGQPEQISESLPESQ